MGRAILRCFETEKEAKAYYEGIIDSIGMEYYKFNKDCFSIIDDRNYNGKFTVNVD